MSKRTQLKQVYKYAPTIGILFFYCIYFYCSTLYLGGTKVDINAVGFDWVENYTCDLFHTHGINGQPNPARPIGMLGILIICTSISLFCFQFTQKIPMTRFWKKAIQVSGTLSMIFAVLIFTDLHHFMLIPTSLCALFALIGIVKGLIQNKLNPYIWTGGACMLLIVLNNYFYFADILTDILPLIQKVTIVLVLTWVMSLNFKLVEAQ